MTATTNNGKEAGMDITYQVYCPCGSGEAVTAYDKGFHATEVQVDCCEQCAQTGVVGRGMRKSWAYANGVVETVGYRHVNGLVTMVGAA